MPIAGTDLIAYKSLNANSDGGAIDTSRPITSGVLDNLFDDITGAEATTGGTDYRKYYAKNTNGSLTWLAVGTWIRQQPPGATIYIGVGKDDAADADATQGNLVQLNANAKVSLQSDGADTRNVTVEGLDTGGNYLTETNALTGTTPVLTTATFSFVTRVYAASTDGSRTVTIKQGSGGPVIGTIAPTKIVSWVWTNTAVGAATALKHGDIGPGSDVAIWLKRTWAAGASAVSGTTPITHTEGQTTP